MVKPNKTVMHSRNFILFLGLCLGFSSTLYGAQQNISHYTANGNQGERTGVDYATSYSRRGVTMPPADYICRKCGLSGHWLEQCKWHTGQPKYPPRDYRCRKCHRHGHWSAYCTKSYNSLQSPGHQYKRSACFNMPPRLRTQQDVSHNSHHNDIDLSTVPLCLDMPQNHNPSPQSMHITQTQPLPALVPAYPNKAKKPDDTWHCTSIKTCKALTAIRGCFQYWRTCEDIGLPKNIFRYLSKDNNYMGIVGAYHHLLEVHLSAQYPQDDYGYINAQITNELYCCFSTCTAYKRNQRQRGKEERKEDEDKEYIFLRDLLDNMHAYLVHGYDSGHRCAFNGSCKIPKDDVKDDEAAAFNTDSGHALYVVDEEVQAIQAWQAHIKPHRSMQRKSDKFQTNIDPIKKPLAGQKISLKTLKGTFGHYKNVQRWMRYLQANECDTDNLLEQVNDSTSLVYANFRLDKIRAYIQQPQATLKNKQPKIAPYVFGVRLYYWFFYKDREKQDVWHHPYLQYKDLYVPPVYSSFKNELLEKGLTIDAWNQTMYEAEMLLALSPALRKTKASGHQYSLYTQYDIKENSTLAGDHVLALLFYANFTSLCTAFRRSLRHLYPSESVQSLISRNSRWYHLSRYIREAVEVFGEKVSDNSRGKYGEKASFYHGVSDLLLSQYNRYFYAPLSTSRQLAVGVLFSHHDGVVVQLTQGDGFCAQYLKFFNVGLVSSFAAEDEHLFIGGKYPMRIASMRILQERIDTTPLMHALSVLHQILNGAYLEESNIATPADSAIAKKLFRSSANLPPYAEKIWRSFKFAQKTLTVDMLCMYNSVGVSFFPLLFSPSVKNLLLFDQLVKIFLNLKQITCKSTDYNGHPNYDYLPSIVNSSFISGIKDCLAKMHKKAKLQKIIIKTTKHKVKDNCNLLVEAFGALGWQISKRKSSKARSRKRIYHTYSTIVLTKK